MDPGWIGRYVVIFTGEGGYAEQAVASAEELIPVPDGVGLREAAALMHDGTTALALAEAARIRPGEWVLVVAAGGGLGILLVQLAHAAGARVIGAARGDRKLAVVRELGAEAVVDYSEPGWAERVREATGGVGPHVVFDGAGGPIGRAAFAITAPGGRFSAHGAPSGGFAEIDSQEAERRGVTVRGINDVQLAPRDRNRLTERALSEAAAGRIRPVIGQTFPLERGTRGELVAAVHTSIGLHRVPQIPQPVDIAAYRANRDLEPFRELGPRPGSAGLQQGEQPQRPRARAGHSAMIIGRLRSESVRYPS